MTNEEKQLLLKDLCARLPYGVKIQRDNVYNADKKVVETLDFRLIADNVEYDAIEGLNIKPYLRPMSSMTEEELQELNDVFYNCNTEYRIEAQDWLNAHHFDCRGLIEKGLALEAPKGMYKTE